LEYNKLLTEFVMIKVSRVQTDSSLRPEWQVLRCIGEGKGTASPSLFPPLGYLQNCHSEGSPNFIGNNELMTGIASGFFVPQTPSQWRESLLKGRVFWPTSSARTPFSTLMNIVIASRPKEAKQSLWT